MMFRSIAAAVAVLLLSSGGEVKNGDRYKCGPNGIVTVSVIDNATMGTIDAGVTNKNGHSGDDVTGTPGSAAGTTTDTPSMSTGGDPDVDCRVSKGKFQYKNSKGDWINAGAPRKASRGRVGGSSWRSTGPIPTDDVTTSPRLSS